MTAIEDLPGPELPFPIYQISQGTQRYILYDINVVTWLRRAHNILGVFTGSLPQAPQQNVFLGLPLELQPEEARLLVEKGIAFVVNDLHIHQKALKSSPKHLEDYKIKLRKDGLAAVKAMERQKQARAQEVLQRLNIHQSTADTEKSAKHDSEDIGDSLFDDATSTRSSQPSSSKLVPYTFTPTTSYPPFLRPSQQQDSLPLPEVDPPSYALFKHLHSLGYFSSPGLRFGCRFTVYPGDPLRFHSHFLAMSAEWDEEIDLLDLVGGGRLGTGVKKGWLIGGVEKKSEDEGGHQSTARGDYKVRTFCIEWGGM
ncbi:MAG: hypothetical protein Q9220_002873 [cf. Caloplaca sp. 1 TL-2023]